MDSHRKEKERARRVATIRRVEPLSYIITRGLDIEQLSEAFFLILDALCAAHIHWQWYRRAQIVLEKYSSGSLADIDQVTCKPNVTPFCSRNVN